eukprot:4941882-Amphidinium_carterae.1
MHNRYYSTCRTETPCIKCCTNCDFFKRSKYSSAFLHTTVLNKTHVCVTHFGSGSFCEFNEFPLPFRQQ